jgi:UDP-N-acetylglucosamine 2-epimerase
VLNLIIIRDHTCISKRKLSKIIGNNSKYFLFASNDASVKNKLEKKYSFNAIYLESKISSTEQHEIALNFINKINKTIETAYRKINIDNNIPENILFISNHIEGGDVNQRIHDIFMYENIYENILKNENIEKLIIVTGKKYYWEDLVFKKVAYKTGISVDVYYNYKFSYLTNKFIYNIKFILKTFFRLFITIKILIIDNCSRSKINLGKNNIIFLQLCSDAEKHYMVIKELGECLNKSRCQELIIGWKASNAKKELVNLNFINLESLLTIKDIVKSIYKVFVLQKFILKEIKKENLNLITDQYVINFSELSIILRSHFFNDISDRIRHFFAIKTLRNLYIPVAIRPWTRILYEAVVLYEVFKNNKSIKYFWQPSTDYLFDGPKIKYLVPADIIFACSQGHKEKLISIGIDPENIFLVGNPWNSRINKFLEKYNKNYSLNLYKIKAKYKLIVFFDPSYVCVHYTIIEQLDALYSLLDLCSDFNELCLIIKPHIGYKGSYLEEIASKMKLSNVMFISKYESPFHALNCSDVIVTKFSNLVLEAMLFKKPSICLLFDNNDQYKIYGDNCDYMYNKKSLKEFFVKSLKDKIYFNNWRDKLLDNHKYFLERHLNVYEKNPSEVIVEYLNKLL